MNKSILLLAVIMLITGQCKAEDKPRTTYVGDGRYTCTGSASQCAQIDANSRQWEQIRQYESDRQRYEADRYIEENRRREKENQYGK